MIDFYLLLIIIKSPKVIIEDKEVFIFEFAIVMKL